MKVEVLGGLLHRGAVVLAILFSSSSLLMLRTIGSATVEAAVSGSNICPLLRTFGTLDISMLAAPFCSCFLAGRQWGSDRLLNLLRL